APGQHRPVCLLAAGAPGIADRADRSLAHGRMSERQIGRRKESTPHPGDARDCLVRGSRQHPRTMAAPTMNWAGNLTYQARACREPATLDELQALVAEPGRLKALGTRHSFNGIGGTTATHISLARLN